MSKQNIIKKLNNLDSMKGCADSMACNYNQSAVIDDGSCEYLSRDINSDGFIDLLDIIQIVNIIISE